MDQNYFDGRDLVPCADRNITFNVFQRFSQSHDDKPLSTVLCLHGAGYTGISWALFANALSSLATDPLRILAPDLRGHGLTFSCHPDNQSSEDLSIDTLVGDVMALCRQLDLNLEKTVVVGHSMGGAVAVRVAASYLQTASIKIGGLVVIDVVEGTALASVPHIKNMLASRPKYFKDTSSAIDWALRNGWNTRQEAAALSIPSQLCKTRWSAPKTESRSDALGTISEENQVELESETAGLKEEELSSGNNTCCIGWTWRTNVEASYSYWEGWYTGLSDAFLWVQTPKLLILAGTDRLDKTLTIAQMQGKFQLVVLPQAGHAVHEDEYDKVARSVWTFISRFRQSDLQTSTVPGSVFRR
jgi:protein phosphatase methylesterase 1